jgi:hypothetical protein
MTNAERKKKKKRKKSEVNRRVLSSEGVIGPFCGWR